MKRKIVKIHEEKCVGCGLCVNACHEGAIQMVDGKAKLVSDSYCDGLGNCLPACPTDAIEIIEREAKPFDKEAVKARKEKEKNADVQENKMEDTSTEETLACGCPGHEAKTFDRSKTVSFSNLNDDSSKAEENEKENLSKEVPAMLQQWPVQLRLINSKAPYLKGADILVAADCTAYAYGNFHEDFIKDKITIIACPKLDDNDYNIEKLTEIFALNDINSITVVRMEVPCCTGIVNAVKKAMLESETIVNYNEVTIGTNGEIK